LERRGIPPGEARRAADLVSKALVFSLSDERGRWILGSHPEARSEYRMRVRTPGGTRTLVMDRVFRENGGERWVVDYKTSRHEGADLEAFLDRERDRYATQLDAYGRLFAGSRRGLYFPLLRGWRSQE
jgi:ATP-dependent exoDNAse (exonuclease V) beta subunit